MIEEDELRLILERAEKRLQRAVVESRTTMQTDHDRPLAHDRSIRDKLHPGNVEVEPNVAHADTHSTTLIRFGPERTRVRGEGPADWAGDAGMTPDKSSPSGPGAARSCRRAVW